MIILLGQVRAEPAAVATLRPALATMMAATRAEPGCLHYSLAVEDEAAGVVSIAERWTDEAALRAHFTAPHMAAFNRAVAGHVRSMTVTVYDATGERPLAM